MDGLYRRVLNIGGEKGKRLVRETEKTDTGEITEKWTCAGRHGVKGLHIHEVTEWYPGEWEWEETHPFSPEDAMKVVVGGTTDHGAAFTENLLIGGTMEAHDSTRGRVTAGEESAKTEYYSSGSLGVETEDTDMAHLYF